MSLALFLQKTPLESLLPFSLVIRCSLIQFYLLATGHCSSLSGFTQSKHPFHHIY